MNAQKTGLLIYEMRTRKNLTQKELAEKCNVTDKAVSKWERGEGCPDVTVLPKLAEIFGIEVESLMKGEIPLSQDVSGKTIKISSVASFIAIIALVIAMYIIHPQMPHINTHAPVFVIIFIIIYKHIPNIVRLIKGEEKRVI